MVIGVMCLLLLIVDGRWAMLSFNALLGILIAANVS